MRQGKMDSLGDIDLMNQFCERKLVFTESVVIESVRFALEENFAPFFWNLNDIFP